MDDWDRPQQRGRPRRLAAVGAFLLLAVVGGLFVRAGALDGPGGALDVDPDATGEGPLLGDPPVETPAPAGGSEDDGADEVGSDGGPGAGRDESGGRPPPDGKAQGGPAGDEAPGGTTADGSLEPLPDAPIAGRSGHTLAWSGEELLVWGGMARHEGARGEFFPDGAAYSPETGSWRVLPPAPLEDRSGHGAAWTGDELVVWGGLGATTHFADGAAYDPGTDTWRAVAPSPLSPRQRPVTVWTGDEVLVLGGSDHAGALRSAAAYSPAEDSWRLLAELPEELSAAWNLDGTWIGDAAVVWAEHADLPGPLARYDLAEDRWTALPPVSRRGPVKAVWTGKDLLALRGLSLVAWRPGQEEWAERATPPGSADPWVDRLHWTGDRLVAARGTGPRRLDVYDPASDAWEEGPALPAGVGHGPGVWSGAALFLWGGAEYGPRGPESAGAAFRPGGDR